MLFLILTTALQIDSDSVTAGDDDKIRIAENRDWVNSGTKGKMRKINDVYLSCVV